MWKEGVIGIPDGSGGYIKCRYWVKVYETPSAEYGIDGGRISKLTRLEAALQLQDRRCDHCQLRPGLGQEAHK